MQIIFHIIAIIQKNFLNLAKYFKINIIEKHFVFDRKLSEYDYVSSLNIKEINEALNNSSKKIKEEYLKKIKLIESKNFVLNSEKIKK